MIACYVFIGVMSSLLQEIVAIYPTLAPPTLTGHGSNRVCNALALLQCVASHNDTRTLFLNGMIIERTYVIISITYYHCYLDDF